MRKFPWTKIYLFIILLLALFLRLYKINTLMAFGGDVARDFLAARDITLKGIIPLVGCPSSVPWLHQGPLFIYLLAPVLWLGKYNPVVGGYFVGVMGVVGVLGVYLLGKKLFSPKAGLLAAFFYATSPLVVIFDRYPYHQSLISFFTVLFFLALPNLVLASLLMGILLQFELSNLVLLPVLAVYFLRDRKKINFRIELFSVLAFMATWLPKIIYDFSHGFTQTLGLVAWAIHKLPPVSFFMAKDASVPFMERFVILSQYFSHLLYWPSPLLSGLFFLVIIILLIEKLPSLILLWLVFPLLGFIIQGSPSESYVPVLFALPALLIGRGLSLLPKKNFPFGLTTLFMLLAFNVGFLLKNNFFLLTQDGKLTEKDYNLDQTYAETQKMAKYIVGRAEGRKYNLMPVGEYARFPSAKSNLIYLTWYLGNGPSEEKEKLVFFVFRNSDKINNSALAITKIFPFFTVSGK